MSECNSCQGPIERDSAFCGHCGARIEADVADTLYDARMPVDMLVGMTLNERYRIGAKLGEGGFGAVYDGVALATGRAVAIKCLNPALSHNKNIAQRFEREAQIMVGLTHPNTITTYDVDKTSGGGLLYIVMERLMGRSLFDVLKIDAPIGWERMCFILSQIASSLAEAHLQGVIHRDLKPENIFLEDRAGTRDFVIVLDFGIAKILHDELEGDAPVRLTASGQAMGTLEYMSPEQLTGRPIDGRSDLYALGVLAYELLTRKLPFSEAKNGAALIAAQMKSEPIAPSAKSSLTIPSAVDELVLKLLSKHPEDRVQSALQLEVICKNLLGNGGSALVVEPLLVQGGAEETKNLRKPDGEQDSDTVHALDKGLPRPLIVLGVGLLVALGVLLLSAL